MDATVHCRNSGHPLSAVASPVTGMTPAAPVQTLPGRLPAHRKQSPPYQERPP